MTGLVRRFAAEEDGAQTVEYALVLGLVALAAVTGLGLAGTAINTWWTNLSSYIGGIKSNP